MRQQVTDRWIEEAEARRVCEWAAAEQQSAGAVAAPLMTRLRTLLMLEAAHLRLALAPSARPAA